MDKPEAEEKKLIFDEHNAHSFINECGKVTQLIERFHWFGEPEKLPHEITCSHLIHYTENDFAQNIGFNNSDFFCFKTQKWDPFNKDNDHYFVWWAALVPDGWDKGINRENPELQKFFKKRFCNSPAFKGESLCGPIGFIVPWKNILEEYAKSREKKFSQIQLKTFGTFFYSREIMYAIIVCIENDIITYRDEDGNEKEFSSIGEETEAFRRTNNSNESFIWKLYSTNDWYPSGHTDRPNGTWDHLSFAFYFPNKNNTLNIPPNLCHIKTKTASERRPHSRAYFASRNSKEMEPDFEIVNKLIDKINQKANY
uniref:Uncharacterized protein n=1 Tax=Panagrolaimus davidi TaxID=227884 RepID=A0A914QFT5_9BILA